MVIQHNIPAINSHRYLGVNNSKTAKNLEKLSSGFKINRAADDAAGLAISEKMRGQISGLGMAEQNANNGISLIQTAEGGLNETHSILQRMRELAVQSSNGTYQDEDRAQIELEYQALKGEIDRIASYTNYNGIKLLDGTVGGAMLSNTSAAVKLQGTNGEVLAMMGVDTATGPAFTPTVTGNLTADDKKIVQDLPQSSGQKIDGFQTVVSSLAFTVTAGTDKTFADFAGNADIILTADGNGGFSAAIKADGTDIFDGAVGTFTASSGLVEFTLKGAASDTKISITLGAADTGSLSELGGEYKAGSTITIGAALSMKTDGSNSSSHVTGVKVNGEANKYATATLATADLAAGDITYTWNDKTNKWNVSGTMTVSSAATPGISEKITFKDLEIDPEENALGNSTVKIGGFTDKNAAITLTFATGQFKVPTEKDLAAGTISMALNGGALTVAPTLSKVEGFKFDRQIQETPDKIRADQMLDAMGLSTASRFNVNKSLAAGNTEQKLIYDALNNKDAYIITRLSTAVDDKGKYDADSQYETVLQVNGESYIGKLESGNWNFYTAEDKNKNSTLVATLTNADLARETGTVRFNTGDQNSQYYNEFLVNKENAQIGSENVSELVFQIGANGAEDQRIGMYVLNMSSDNLGNHAKGKFVSESTILTRTQANEAVNTLDSAIVYVASQRAELGALQNRLEHTLNNLGVTKENLTAAESSIRDVDMAKEMMDFTKNNILVQAAQAMLAQANQLPQGVLQLLR